MAQNNTDAGSHHCQGLSTASPSNPGSEHSGSSRADCTEGASFITHDWSFVYIIHIVIQIENIQKIFKKKSHMILPLEIIIVVILEISSRYIPIYIKIYLNLHLYLYMYIKSIYIYNTVCTNIHFLIFEYVANTYVNKYIPTS